MKLKRDTFNSDKCSTTDAINMCNSPPQDKAEPRMPSKIQTSLRNVQLQ